MNAATLAKALGGRRCGRGWLSRCCAHEDRTPSLSINEIKGRVLVHCHAGCEQRAVIDALRQRNLWSGELEQIVRGGDEKRQEREREVARRDYALRLWHEAETAAGTLVEVYLRSRGILLPPPPTLRYRASLWHGPSKTSWPCMVAVVVDGANQSIGIHRTFLASDGKAPIEPNKMMLGACKGGVVHLAPAADGLLLGEGIETVLSAMQMLRRPGWAALSAGNLASLDLPSAIRSVTVLADDDPAGRAAALTAARRWRKQGRDVRIELPEGGDFNDELRAK
jgi:putative DNA primase/helicase